jgi:hypothetical protein
MKTSIYDIATQTEIVRDYTESEAAEIATLETRLSAEVEAAQQQAQDKESGNQKLKDLGLTDDEIAAITS